MTIRSILFKISYSLTIGLILVIFLVGIFFFYLADPLNLRAPKDQILLKVFHDHREEFEKLQKMALEDLPNVSYFNDSVLNNSKLSRQRQEEYKYLLDKIWPSLTITIGNDDQVLFIFAGGGILSIGPEWSKGIVYKPYDDKSGTIAPNLDKMRTAPANDYIRPIEPKWFLFYQRYDD